MNIQALRKNIPGIGLCILISIAAWFSGSFVPVVGGAVFGILYGIIAGQFKRPAFFTDGIRYTGKKILQYSIILLGFEMQISNVITVGGQSLFIMLFTLTAAFVTTVLMARVLHIQGNTAILVGVGTSICGGSAIAATAPVIGAKEEEVAQAISTIFLFNIIAVFLFPPLGRLLHLSDEGFGLWAGTAVNDTSSVVASAAAWSEAAGNNTALTLATIVKLTRTLMIIPITVVLAFYTARKQRRSDALSSFSLAKTFPWFVLGFVATSILNSFLPIPAGVSHFLVSVGKFMIVMAMTAIGLSTDIHKLISNGKKPLILGLSCWVVVAAVSLLVQSLTGKM